MKEKTLGKIARDAFFDAKGNDGQDWAASAAAVVAEHERRKWRTMSTCPACGEEIIAGFRDADGWHQTIGNAAILRELPYYTHWQPAPEGPKP